MPEKNGPQDTLLMEFSMTPLGQGESVSEYVAQTLDIIDKSGVDYQLHAMGTLVEGEIDQILNVFRQCLTAMSQNCNRISCSAKLDFRKGVGDRLSSKVRSVEAKLGRQLRT
ncbi:MAG: MTH1187 family thiamine-binding protein [Planctomycetaceae bacterium]|nr:MTH1187 family thiamine-binding protein [Planctomycetaceae bacterium]